MLPSALLVRELRLALRAWGFFTRAPVPDWVWGEDADFAPSMRWFALAGAAVGLLAGIVFALASAVGAPGLAAAALALIASALLTGALHEDGWADVADGLGGGATRERALEIMRDSRVGAFGALALGLGALLKAGALAALSPLGGLAALICAHAAGRAAIVLAIASADYARAAGLGAGLDREAAGRALPLALATAALVSLGCGLWGLGALAAALAMGMMVLAWARRRLGGWTGDVLGAVEQSGEMAALLVLSAALA